MCNVTPDELLKVKPVTEADGVLPYSERTMRVIADTSLSHANTIEPRSVFVRKMLQSLEPWVTVDAKGKMPKRIAAYLHDNYKASLPERVMSGVGNFLALEAPAGKFYYDITDRLLWTAGDFGDRGSCFMQGRTDVPRALSDDGGKALRFWSPAPGANNHGVENFKGNARAWVMPSPLDGLPIIFNAYGASLDQYASRMRLIIPDTPVTPIFLTNKGSRSGHVYINGGIGLMVGAEAREFSMSVDLKVETGSNRPRRCDNCGDRVRAQDMYHVTHADGMPLAVCHTCYNAFYVEDAIGGDRIHHSLMTTVQVVLRTVLDRDTGRRVFQNGIALANISTLASRVESLWRCPRCNNLSPFSCVYTSEGGQMVDLCEVCAPDTTYIYECQPCGRYLATDETCSCGRHRNELRRFSRW